MNDQDKPPTQSRQIPVTNNLTGETKMIDAPPSKPRNAPPSDATLPTDSLPIKSSEKESVSSPAPSPPKDESPVAAKDQSPDSADKNKKRKIESCDEYLELYFSGKVKSLGDEIISTIGSNSSVSTSKRAGLIDGAIKADFTLDKTRNLLLLSLHASTYSGLAKSLREFVRDIVGRHPVMGDQGLDVWFPRSTNEDTWNPKLAWSAFASKTSKNLASDDDESKDKKVTPADIQKARRNAFLCACVWRYAEQLVRFPEFLRSMRNSSLQSTTEASDLEREVLNYLVSLQDKDRSGAADFIRWSYEQTVHVQNMAEQYRSRYESLQNQKKELDEILEIKDHEIQTLHQEATALRARIASMEEEIRIHKVHSKDDLERQSSRTLRALEDEIPVLTDCLTALNRDPPKVEVAKEYLATALDTLNDELKILREK